MNTEERQSLGMAVSLSIGLIVVFSAKGLYTWAKKKLETMGVHLSATFEQIKFGLLFVVGSYFVLNWSTIIVGNICFRPSATPNWFFPSVAENSRSSIKILPSPFPDHLNESVSVANDMFIWTYRDCPAGTRTLFSLGTSGQFFSELLYVTLFHSCYGVISIILAFAKIYRWKKWDAQAKSMSMDETQGNGLISLLCTSSVVHSASHSWSQSSVLDWLLCSSLQFGSSINRAGYIALRFSFISTRGLPLTYDFHDQMIHNVDEKFRHIVGLRLSSIILLSHAFLALHYHGTELYYVLSFLPVIFIVLLGTKLHREAIKVAVEARDSSQVVGRRLFMPQDNLFWLWRPRLLLHLLELISVQCGKQTGPLDSWIGQNS